jgi:hypothetical protein
MEEPGEQCTVVFALIVTGLASKCVCVCGGGGVATPSPPPPPTLTLGSYVTIYAKTILHCSPVIEFLNNLWGLGTE